MLSTYSNLFVYNHHPKISEKNGITKILLIYGHYPCEVDTAICDKMLNSYALPVTFKLGLAARPFSVAILMSCPTPLWSSTWKQCIWTVSVKKSVWIIFPSLTRLFTLVLSRKVLSAMKPVSTRRKYDLPQMDHFEEGLWTGKWVETFPHHLCCIQRSFVWDRWSRRRITQLPLQSMMLISRLWTICSSFYTVKYKF